MKPQSCVALLILWAAQSSGPARPAVASDPITGILNAFSSHSIVALSDGTTHGNEQAAAFRVALIQHSQFADVVNDIVVESGNARYQDIIDRFTRGDAVDDADLRKVWQNTTQPHTVWDVPIYEQFFREVRAVNLTRHASTRLRVLLGDPPVDWDRLATGETLKGVAPEDRERYPVEVIRREVIAKHRRALIVYGGGHLRRRNANNDTIVALLEQAGVSVFNVWTDTEDRVERLQPDAASWPRPSLALLPGTTLGAAAFDTYMSPDAVTIQNGQVIAGNAIPWRQLPMQQQFDAVLYLGPRSSMTQSKLSPALCSDPQYLAMRMARMADLPAPPGQPSAVDQLKQYCAGVAR